jgi:DNA-binding MurR/RpiR family transcriptional regulator
VSKKRASKAEVIAAARRVATGESLMDVAKETGVSPSAIHRRLAQAKAGDVGEVEMKEANNVADALLYLKNAYDELPDKGKYPTKAKLLVALAIATLEGR